MFTVFVQTLLLQRASKTRYDMIGNTYIHTYIHTNLYSAKNHEDESEALAQDDYRR